MKNHFINTNINVKSPDHYISLKKSILCYNGMRYLKTTSSQNNFVILGRNIATRRPFFKGKFNKIRRIWD